MYDTPIFQFRLRPDARPGPFVHTARLALGDDALERAARARHSRGRDVDRACARCARVLARESATDEESLARDSSFARAKNHPRARRRDERDER